MLALLGVLACAGCWSGPPSDRPAPAPTQQTQRSDALDDVALRAAHTATTTPDGDVLVAGGCTVDGCSTATSSVVAVDAAGNVSSRPALLSARDAHTAALLGDGSVLVAGGFSGEGQPPLASAETLAPGGTRWQETAPMRTPRGGHAAARFGDGRVLVAGGWVASQTYTDSTEIYDPVTRRFVPGPRLPLAVDGLAAAPLPDGSVLVAGGQVRPGVATNRAVVVHADGTRTPVAPLAQARFKHAMVPLPSGEVLVIGGTVDDERLLTSTELFDPRTRTWRPGPELSSGRYKLGGAAVALPDGRVVVAGGGPGIEVIDVGAGTSRPYAPGQVPPVRGSFSTVSIVGDRVLVLGGYDEDIRLTGRYTLIGVRRLGEG